MDLRALSEVMKPCLEPKALPCQTKNRLNNKCHIDGGSRTLRVISVLGALMSSISPSFAVPPTPITTHEITISGTCFFLNGEPFPYTGVSFFNAIYNPAFNSSSDDRTKWMKGFQRYGINVLRLWAQWDNRLGFVDTGPGQTLYYEDGQLRIKHLNTLKSILSDADQCGMVVELALLSRESHDWPINETLAPEAADKGIVAVAEALLPYRNLTLQIWNEYSERVSERVEAIRAIDPKRLISNSPDFPGTIGDEKHNALLDYLTPHTSRQFIGKPWELAPAEISYLLKRFQKPVVDDEPARNGTAKFGGPNEATSPFDHILQFAEVWRLGGYITYHHDMFQHAYGAPTTPPSGIPDPEFNPYHRQVFEFIAQRKRYMKTDCPILKATDVDSPQSANPAWR